MHHDSTVLVRLVADKTKVGLIETTCIKLPSIRELSVIYIYIYIIYIYIYIYIRIWYGCIYSYICKYMVWLYRVCMYACSMHSCTYVCVLLYVWYSRHVE